MQLNDSLQVCLLSLVSRYPNHILDINELVLGSQCFDVDGWLAADLIEELEQDAPDLLLATARLVVDPQKSEIYLLDYSERVPAVFVHCRGRLPECRDATSPRQTYNPQEAPFPRTSSR